jgi:hypothetical protein
MNHLLLRRLSATLLPFLLAVRLLGAAADESSAAKQVEQIKADFDSAKKKHQQAVAGAKDEAERDKLGSLYPQAPEYAAKLLEVARKVPGTPVELDALLWVLERAYYDEKSASTAMDLLMQHHAESKELLSMVQFVSFSSANNGEQFLRTVIEKNPNKSVKASAIYNLGVYLQDDWRSKPENREKGRKEAERLYETILSDYPEEESLVTSSKGQLYELRNLNIGQAAPEIEGEDVDGKKFRLSDYRGKVVVLDFWGDW